MGSDSVLKAQHFARVLLLLWRGGGGGGQAVNISSEEACDLFQISVSDTDRELLTSVSPSECAVNSVGNAISSFLFSVPLPLKHKRVFKSKNKCVGISPPFTFGILSSAVVYLPGVPLFVQSRLCFEYVLFHSSVERICPD